MLKRLRGTTEDRVLSSFKRPQLRMSVGDSYKAWLRLHDLHGAALYCSDTLSFDIRRLRKGVKVTCAMAASIAILFEG